MQRIEHSKVRVDSAYVIIIIIIIQNLQAKNCKLGVMSEMAHSLAQKLLGCESVPERYFISSLQWYWQPLEQILWLQRFQCGLSDSFAKFGDEFQGFAVPRSSSFYGNWYEVVRGSESVVFCGFVGRRLVRRSSNIPSCFTDVRCGICVWDSDVPSERFSTLQRDKSCTIWSLPVGSWEPDLFLGGRNLSSFDRSPNQVIQLRLPYMSWSTFPTGQSVQPSGVDCCATDAYVSLACCAAEPEANRITNCFIG